MLENRGMPQSLPNGAKQALGFSMLLRLAARSRYEVAAMETLTRTDRLQELYTAQDQAVDLFDAIIDEGLIRPGVTETDVSKEILALARDRFGVVCHWHKRLVRAGVNTLSPYSDNPPNRLINDDDIVFVDLGPVFAEWEADFGRTYVLGDDPVKHKLVADLPIAFDRAREAFEADVSITGEQLYDRCRDIAADLGWTYGGPLAGHLIGEFPHKKIYKSQRINGIVPGNRTPMRDPDRNGLDRFWILEIHLTDPKLGIGGFYEELLNR
jgi:Xaa-Pro aminopeptidase